MAAGDQISCKEFASFLVSQEPVYDKEILRDVRPFDGLIGYYLTSAFDSYSGVQHTFDRFNSVFPNLTQPWTAKTNTPCLGTPCDPDSNKLGWGYTRNTYHLEQQSWESNLLCFDEILPKTRAKEHFQQIIDEVLRPATNWIMTDYLLKRAADFAGKKWAVATGLPDFTFSWAAGGYVTMTSSVIPTGMLTPSMLQSRVRYQYLQGAVMANKQGFDSLQLHTDMDTLHRLMQEDATLKSLWRFASFGPAAVEFYKYGLSAQVGDFMVKVLQFPIRFIKNSNSTFTVVLPYKNIATTEGIRSIPNEDYDKAQYQWSYINNPRALRILPFKAEAVNPEMPFVVRDYAGRWRFVNNDLGSCGGQAIDNSRGNKGKFIADFLLATKPEHPEWLELIFHKVDKPCITIIDSCNPYPGYPAQSYASVDTPCDQVLIFTPVLNGGNYVIAQNSIQCNGNPTTHSAISSASLAALVTDLTTQVPEFGTWAIVSGSTTEIQLTGATCSTVSLPFTLA
jgi:hypothetical protein